jgi:host factor-I protein
MPIAHRPAEYEGTSFAPRRARGAVVDIKRGPRKPARVKPAPPDQTNAESFYYLKQMNAKTPMVVVMTDGEEIRGWIEWYDKSCLKINREGAPNLVVQKHCIKYLFKQDEITG